MFNALTIDIEDYFQVHAFSRIIRYEDWGSYECRIEQNTNRILEILNLVHSPIIPKPQYHSTATHEHSEKNSPQHLNFNNNSITHSLNNSLTPKVQATFFVLGWIAERYPNLIKRIQKEGHEIACHGYAHKLIYHQSKKEFRSDIRKAKAILEEIIGDGVVGYRAPSYSITNKSKWAFQVLLEEGFKYDSSIFPIRHFYYGIPNAPRFPFIVSLNENNNVEFSTLKFEKRQHSSTSPHNNSITDSLINSNSLIEFPISTIRILRQNFPISGGGYFRLFPYPLIKKGLKSINEKENKPFIFYVHPWELDVDQPHIKDATNLSKFRHYVNLDKTREKFRELLKDFDFSSVKNILELNNLLTH